MAQEEIGQTAEDLKSAAGETVEVYREKAEQVWDDAKNRGRTIKKGAEEYIRENPTKVVFTALGIGFVLGLIALRH